MLLILYYKATPVEKVLKTSKAMWTSNSYLEVDRVRKDSDSVFFFLF